MLGRNIQIIDHTADIGIRVSGDTLEELFKTAAIGMIRLMVEVNEEFSIDEIIAKEIEVEGADNEDLLVSFLAEILYLFEGEGFVPTDFSGGVFDGGKFKITAVGESFDPDRHITEIGIKAVTYHKMKIEKRNGKWMTDVIFDV